MKLFGKSDPLREAFDRDSKASEDEPTARVLYRGEEYDVMFADNEHGTLTLLSDEGEDFVVFATYCQAVDPGRPG